MRTFTGQRLQSGFGRLPLQQQPQIRPYGATPQYPVVPGPQPGAASYGIVGTPPMTGVAAGGGGPVVGGGGGGGGGPGAAAAVAAAGGGSVIMIYGLATNRAGCDHLFNLLCSYGNVLKVKILINKPGTAMSHMDSPQGARNAIQHLHGHKLLGQTLELNFSRHSYIADYSQGEVLPDGSPCWKDYSQSRNNRFVTAEGTSKNRIISPGKIMHFYNSPPDSTEETLKELFTNVQAEPPSSIKFFSQGAKSATGLLEWNDEDTALDAFVLANHQTAMSKAGQAYTFKLAFSSNSSLDQHPNSVVA